MTDIISNKKNKYLRLLEFALFSGGIVLLGIFAVTKVWSENQSSESIEVFEEYIASTNVDTEYIQEHHDTSLWSVTRIKEYEEALILNEKMPLGVLKIEKLKLEVPIFNGTSDLILNRGLGRIIGTSRIDQQGNLGIAGHRDSFFRGLKDIKVGDTMELKTLSGNDHYKVTSITITHPDDVSVLAPTDDSTITLVTCYPFYFVGHAPERYIVKAKKEFNQESS